MKDIIFDPDWNLRQQQVLFTQKYIQDLRNKIQDEIGVKEIKAPKNIGVYRNHFQYQLSKLMTKILALISDRYKNDPQ